MKQKYIICYGSLKSGFHNNYRLGQNRQFIGHVNIVGCMYLHHNYPKLYKPDPDKNIPTAIHRCEIWAIDEDCYEEIVQMEKQAGYEVENLATQWTPETKIFWMPWKHFDKTDKPITRYDYGILDKETREYLERNMHEKPIP